MCESSAQRTNNVDSVILRQLEILQEVVGMMEQRHQSPHAACRRIVQLMQAGNLPASFFPALEGIDHCSLPETIAELVNKCGQTALQLSGQIQSVITDTNLPLTLHRVLASGTTSTIWVVQRTGLSQLQVLKATDKVRFNAYCAQHATTAKYESEFKMLEQCSHTLIPKVHATFDTPGVFYFLMDFVGETDLFDHLVRTGPVPLGSCRKMTKDIFRVLQYLQALAIIHRDVKPQNLVLCDRTDDSKIKLIDFGLARASPGTTRIGTRGYMAPEIYMPRKGKCYSSIVDSWSAGVTLYELLSAEPPFEDALIAEQTKAGLFQFDGSIWEQIDESAKDLVCQLLDVNEHSRLSASEALGHPWLDIKDS